MIWKTLKPFSAIALSFLVFKAVSVSAQDPDAIMPAVCTLVNQESCSALDVLPAKDRNKLNVSAANCFKSLEPVTCPQKIIYLFNDGNPALSDFWRRICATGFEPACFYLEQMK